MKIIPSALIDTITQTSGGTTIQNSYGGLQLHKKAYQIRKKSFNQQNRRSAFTNVQSSWGSLTTEEQETWNTATDAGVSGFELYSSTNNRLVSSGAGIIPEYVTPTIDPINDATAGAQTFNFSFHPFFYQLEITSTLMLFPTSGWNVYIKWTGWITGNQYRYPQAKLTIPQEAIAPINADSMFFQLDEPMSDTFRNFRNGSKAQFFIGIINTTTGQVFNYLTHNAIADF